MMKTLVILALVVACASAFAPALFGVQHSRYVDFVAEIASEPLIVASSTASRYDAATGPFKSPRRENQAGLTYQSGDLSTFAYMYDPLPNFLPFILRSILFQNDMLC